MFLLVLLGASFMRGFREVIGLAVVIVGIYLVLNAVVIGAGAGPPDRAPGRRSTNWLDRVRAGEWYLTHNPIGRSPAPAC